MHYHKHRMLRPLIHMWMHRSLYLITGVKRMQNQPRLASRLTSHPVWWSLRRRSSLVFFTRDLLVICISISINSPVVFSFLNWSRQYKYQSHREIQHRPLFSPLCLLATCSTSLFHNPVPLMSPSSFLIWPSPPYILTILIKIPHAKLDVTLQY